ncbi:MAG: hypothetical protein R2744_08945 [Bacteroidales bacterium]
MGFISSIDDMLLFSTELNRVSRASTGHIRPEKVDHPLAYRCILFKCLVNRGRSGEAATLKPCYQAVAKKFIYSKIIQVYIPLSSESLLITILPKE